MNSIQSVGDIMTTILYISSKFGSSLGGAGGAGGAAGGAGGGGGGGGAGAGVSSFISILAMGGLVGDDLPLLLPDAACDLFLSEDEVAKLCCI